MQEPAHPMPTSPPASPLRPSEDPLLHIRSAPADRPFVVAQLGQALDGRIATESGESRWINKDAALDHVHRIRAAVDAVVIGVGTAVADDPQLNVRRVTGRNPTRVVIDPSGRLPLTARCLAPDGTRRIIVRAIDSRGPAPNDVEILYVTPDAGRLPPRAIVAALWQAGVKRLLIEGGAATVSAFIDDDALDRLHVLVAPVILGSGKPGLTLSPIKRLADARRPHAEVHVLHDGDVLFDCNMRRR